MNANKGRDGEILYYFTMFHMLFNIVAVWYTLPKWG